jgi:hypothetical protein
MARLIEFLADALTLLFVVRLIVRFFATGAPARGRPAAPRAEERAGGTLVRDPHCGTYIPESRAIRAGSGDQTVYFCSTACRDAYQSRS